MKRNRNYELIAHHSMATVGGFFGVYALLNRSETFGSSTTANLIYIFAAGLSRSLEEFFIRIIALCLYGAGIVLATLLARASKRGDCRYASVIIDVACCLILAQIPSTIHPVLALYPMFFATAFQWVACSKVGEFQSSSIFSTNNMRQTLAGLTNYLCDRNPQEWQRFFVFGTTLIFFHAGVVYGWFCMQAWGLKSIYACIPLAVVGGAVTWVDRRRLKQ